jgi:hypothetical protein
MRQLATFRSLSFLSFLWRVLKFLSENTARSAQMVLSQLTTYVPFTENWSRTDLLITAAPPLRPLPRAFVKFKDEHCQPGDGFMNLTIESLAANGCTPAVQLLDKNLLRPVSRMRIRSRGCGGRSTRIATTSRCLLCASGF